MQDLMMDISKLLASGTSLHFFGGAVGAASSCYDRAGRIVPFGLLSGLVVCMVWQGMAIFGGFDVGNEPLAYLKSREIMQLTIVSMLLGAAFAWLVDQAGAEA